MRAAAALVLAASLTACASGEDDDPTITAPTSAAPSSSGLVISARDYSFVGVVDLAPKAGDTVPFTLKNISSDSEHDFVLTGPDGKESGVTDPLDPGASTTGTLTFAKAGTYTFVCTVGDHERKGMKGTITVT